MFVEICVLNPIEEREAHADGNVQSAMLDTMGIGNGKHVRNRARRIDALPFVKASLLRAAL